jgi:probable phosphoglycerate mutase
VPTLVYLVRHGATAWHREGKVLGSRDLPLDDAGVTQAEGAAAALADAGIAEVVTSPLMRALKSAEVIGARTGIEVARDPRLCDLRMGSWEGQRHDAVMATPEWQRFAADPENEKTPAGESLGDLHRRSRGAVEQALADNPAGDAIALVTHAAVIRVLVCDALGAPLSSWHRIRIRPGSITALTFTAGGTRVLTVDWMPDLAQVLGGGL